MKRSCPKPIPPNVDDLIVAVRDQPVVLDSHLACLYGVPTFRFNEAVKRNRHRFPPDFRFKLTAKEWSGLRTTFARSPLQDDTVPNSSQIAMSSARHRGKAYRPWAFTEHGALMAATILSSDRAVEMSVYVIRAFVKMRAELGRHQDLGRRLAEVEKTLTGHDEALRELYLKIRSLLFPPPEPKRREIGFHAKTEVPD